MRFYCSCLCFSCVILIQFDVSQIMFSVSCIHEDWGRCLIRFSVNETVKAYRSCILKLRQQQQLYIQEQDDQHLFEVEHGILDILGRAHPRVVEIQIHCIWIQIRILNYGPIGTRILGVSENV